MNEKLWNEIISDMWLWIQQNMHHNNINGSFRTNPTIKHFSASLVFLAEKNIQLEMRPILITNIHDTVLWRFIAYFLLVGILSRHTKEKIFQYVCRR